MTTEKKSGIEAWGLSIEAINELPERLQEFHERYRRYLCTRTRDTSAYGIEYISSLMRMETKRNIANIGRTSQISEQNMQQFISDSPWRADHLIKSVQSDISRQQQFASGNILIIDESADEKAGETSAGAGRQHNGRLGKVDCCQVGVFLGLANNGYQTWIDGELFIPKAWFEETQQDKRQRIGIPEGRVFATKLELALQLLERTVDAGVLSFDAVDMDALYGRKGLFRDQVAKLGIEYYGDIPANTRIYLKEPLVYFAKRKNGKQAKRPTIDGVFTTPSELKTKANTEWHHFVLRSSERGMLKADFARFRVWTVEPDGHKRQEWLLIRQDPGDVTYSLSNAPLQTPLLTMAERKSQRFAIERSNQNAKSELGWGEFQAIKFNAWSHHLALSILASWFITETKLDWDQKLHRDPALLQLYEVDVLPALSFANVRTLLRSALPLPQLSPQQAAELVVKHLDNRTRSRKSRLIASLSP